MIRVVKLTSNILTVLVLQDEMYVQYCEVFYHLFELHLIILKFKFLYFLFHLQYFSYRARQLYVPILNRTIDMNLYPFKSSILYFNIYLIYVMYICKL